MPRGIIAFMFTFILMVVTIAPAVLTIVESNSDIALFFDIGEEEESKSKKSIKNLEIKVLQAQASDILFLNKKNRCVLNTYNNTYSSVYKQIFSPPPRFTSYKIS